MSSPVTSVERARGLPCSKSLATGWSIRMSSRAAPSGLSRERWDRIFVKGLPAPAPRGKLRVAAATFGIAGAGK